MWHHFYMLNCHLGPMYIGFCFIVMSFMRWEESLAMKVGMGWEQVIITTTIVTFRLVVPLRVTMRYDKILVLFGWELFFPNHFQRYVHWTSAPKIILFYLMLTCGQFWKFWLRQKIPNRGQGGSQYKAIFFCFSPSCLVYRNSLDLWDNSFLRGVLGPETGW